MGTSILHIKTDVECIVFLFDEEKGIATPGKWFNVEVRIGEQDILLVSTELEALKYQTLFHVEKTDWDYRLEVQRNSYSLDMNKLIMLAEHGDSIAQNRLGVCYYNGDNIEKNWEKAVEWYRKAAEQGNIKAQYNIGCMCMKGEGMPRQSWDSNDTTDWEQAKKWFKMAAEQGDAAAQNKLGYLFEEDWSHSEEMLKEGLMWYQKAAEKGYVDAMYNLGRCYAKGKGVEQNWELAVKWYRKASEIGEARSQSTLGWCYLLGNGVEQSREDAKKWFRLAAEQGNAFGQFCLGAICYDAKNYEEAVKWFLKAAEYGYYRLPEKKQYAIACNILGWCYAEGRGVKQDGTEALRWLEDVERTTWFDNGKVQKITIDWDKAITLFRKMAEHGDLGAQVYLGKWYANGTRVGVDYIESAKWYLEAARLGDEPSQHIIGEYYAEGKGVDQDWEEALKWLEKSWSYHWDKYFQMCLPEAEAGNPKAQLYVGWCYANNRGVNEDKVKTVKWYQSAAEQENSKAQYELAKCYEYGQGVGESKEIALNWYRKAAEHGEIIAQRELGEMYEHGVRCVKKDYKESYLWYHKAAEKGDSDSQCRLGVFYEFGYGIERNYEEAIKWYRKAAEQRDSWAAFRLGHCYRVEKNYSDAMIWFREVAEHGYYLASKAQYELGVCYAKGYGVNQDYKEAIKWFLKAAEDNNSNAQVYLGICYQKERDYEESLKWYRKALEQGCIEADDFMQGYDRKHEVMVNYKKAVQGFAQDVPGNESARSLYMLGVHYEFGHALEADYTEAIRWYRKAAELGDMNAQNRLELLIKKKDSCRQIIPYYLFFDTETSGLPKDDSAPASDTRNWPRLVQLAWILTDKDGKVMSSKSYIIKPDGFTISKDATKVHGIDNYKATREGKPLKNVIEEFLNAAEKAKCLVGHNIAFDQKVVGAELCRLGIKDTISTVKGICTMKNSTDYCELPGGYYGYKPPKLQELYHKLFGCNFDDAHDAMADVKATMKCFFELKRRDLMIEIAELQALL